MKKTLIWFAKATVSGLIALGIVSFLSFFYYNLPVHYTNTTGATDYFWDKNNLSMRGTEGFAYTQTDENGFVNTFPIKQDDVDVLIMGSSHAEGFNVNADENFTYLLNEKLKENGLDKYAYSIGMSAHNIIRCLNNLDDALTTYRPSDYVVIETSSIELKEDALTQLNEGTFEKIPSVESGLIYYLQKMDFFRLTYAQITNAMANDQNQADGQNNKSTPSSNADGLTDYQNLLETTIRNAGETASKNGCQLVIVYSPQTKVDYNGNFIKDEYTSKQKLFKSLCEKYDIILIDMISSYEAMYEKTQYLPHGFSNTAIGSGHINKYGHRCIAEEIYETIIEG